MRRVQTPMIPVVGEWIVQHPGTISLGQGIVHYAPPAQVTAAVAKAVQGEPRIHRYGMVRGIPELLAPIERKIAAENQIDLAGRQQVVVVTAGSNMGFLNAVLAIGDVDDEVILLSPYYFNHEMAIQLAGCRPVIVPTDHHYQLDVPALEAAITSRTRAIVTVSPSNPTGAVYQASALDAVNELCRSRGIYHVSDEAYEYFIYGDRRHYSPASRPESARHTISLFSLSKAYGMAGWRVGYMVVPAELETAIKKIQDTNLVCPPILSQFAAAAALELGAGWCAEKIAEFACVRDLVLTELNRLGTRCRVPRPDGAFYVLAELETDQTDVALVERLIREFGVAVMPGSTFGAVAPTALRIAYGALARETVAEGMGRLVNGLGKILDAR